MDSLKFQGGSTKEKEDPAKRILLNYVFLLQHHGRYTGEAAIENLSADQIGLTCQFRQVYGSFLGAEQQG